MNSRYDIKRQLRIAVLAVFCIVSLATLGKADISGDEVSGEVTVIPHGTAIEGSNDVDNDNTEFLNANFHGLCYQLNIDGAPFKRVKVTICNPDEFVAESTLDTIWLVSDLDCLNDDGTPVPATVTQVVLLAGNSLTVSESIPFLGDGLRIRTAFGQEIPAGEDLCAEFAIITENDVPGDVNGDGLVNLLDIAPFIGHFLDGSYSPGADVNRDGAVNLLDVSHFIDALQGS